MEERSPRQERIKYDWRAIEDLFSSGSLSNIAIAKMFGCSESSIRHRANRYRWKKDPNGKIERRRLEILANRKIKESRDVKLEDVQKGLVKPPKAVFTSDELVDLIAGQSADVVENHRADIVHARVVAGQMMRELAATSGDPARLAEAIRNFAELEKLALATPMDKAHMVKSIKNALNLGNRSVILRNLTAALDNLIRLERQAYDLDLKENERPSDAPPLEERVKAYSVPFEPPAQATGTDGKIVPIKVDE